MQLIPWHHSGREGFTLRGWHSRPSGKPLLHFLHGNGFCCRMYEPMLEVLAKDFDLWLCDIQGHGDSDHGGPFVGWNRNAELAMEGFRHLGGQAGGPFANVPHHAVGHSMGGVLTGLILGEHPKHFSRAVLLDPVLFTPAMIMGMSVAELTGITKLSPMARQARARRRHWASRDEAFSMLHNRGVYKGWTDEALRAFVTHALKDSPNQDGVELKCKPSREADVFSTGPDRLWSLLGRVRTPTLVLRASRTYPFIKESAGRWQLVNEAVSDEEYKGGHCFMQEQPEASAKKVRDFLLSAN